MKNITLLFCLTFTVFETAQAAIVCSGWNKQNQPIVLRIEEVGKSSNGFKLVSVKKSTLLPVSNPINTGKPNAKTLAGCENALFAGEKNGQLIQNYSGNLYVECDGDGDAGFMELNKTGRNNYNGRFVAPNGKTVLGLSDEQEVVLTCTAK